MVAKLPAQNDAEGATDVETVGVGFIRMTNV